MMEAKDVSSNWSSVGDKPFRWRVDIFRANAGLEANSGHLRHRAGDGWCHIFRGGARTRRFWRLTMETIKELQKIAYEVAKSKGWYDKGGPSFGDQIANMHSELTEAWEGYRHHNPPSEHIPEFTAIEEEFADVVIRVMVASEHEGHRLHEAIFAKIEFNKTRAHRYGGKKV